jgi:predicted nuclease of predicted toxin-antitoxin system
LDENLGRACQAILVSAGHDVATVHEQSLAGRPDEEVIGVCRTEGRCLMTLDVEFGNPLVFPPKEYAGIIVLRLRDNAVATDLRQALGSLLRAFEKSSPIGKLWIVQHDRVREYQDPNADD